MQYNRPGRRAQINEREEEKRRDQTNWIRLHERASAFEFFLSQLRFGLLHIQFER